MKLLRAAASMRHMLPEIFRLMRHEQVPFGLKAGAVGLGLLIVSPLDLLSDIPVLGLLDDAALLALLGWFFVRLASRRIAPPAAVPMRVVNR